MDSSSLSITDPEIEGLLILRSIPLRYFPDIDLNQLDWPTNNTERSCLLPRFYRRTILLHRNFRILTTVRLQCGQFSINAKAGGTLRNCPQWDTTNQLCITAFIFVIMVLQFMIWKWHPNFSLNRYTTLANRNTPKHLIKHSPNDLSVTDQTYGRQF